MASSSSAPAVPVAISATLALFASACLPGAQIVQGSSSYTSTPPSADSTGAAPTTAVWCPGPASSSRSTVYVKVDRCELRVGFYRPGRELAVEALGPCEVTGSNGPLVLDVERAAGTSSPLDITLGGRSKADGRYVTYRFVGVKSGASPDEGACDWTAKWTPRPVPVDPPWDVFESRPVGS